MNYKIKDNHIELEKLGEVKKITGTRLATILGLNAWSTAFEAWCDMTKLYAKPFEDSIYTIAGKTIEPMIIKYLNNQVFPGRVVDPETYFGKDFTKMRFDFWPKEPIFGGMWDALIVNKKTGAPKAVIEIKTTKRAEDWQTDIPLYYKIQAMLYAKLLNVTQVVFAVAFLDESIYEDPTKFVASAKTVKVIQFDLDDTLISNYMADAIEWHQKFVNNLMSPDFDEKKDAEILKELRTNRVEATESIDDYLATLDEVRPILDANEREMKPYADRLKAAEDGLKKELEAKFTDQDNTVAIKSGLYEFRVNRSIKDETSFNEIKFKKDHPDLYAEYLITTAKATIRKQIKALEVVSE